MKRHTICSIVILLIIGIGCLYQCFLSINEYQRIYGAHFTLIDAARSGNMMLAMELLEQTDSDIHLQDTEGKTPLMIAKEKGNTHMVRLLLEHGA